MDLPILNPGGEELQGTRVAYRLLVGQDKDAEGYGARFGGEVLVQTPVMGEKMPLRKAI